jgi:LysM repeat protein
MLKMRLVKYYKVKAGQSLREIAEAFSVAEGLLIKENGLTQAPYAGQILKIPSARGNAYIVCEGDTKELLCGSAQAYREKNGTDIFYIGMRVIL